MTDDKKKKLRIKPIRNGIVIDHIKQGKAPEVLRILGIDEKFGDAVTIAMNIPSKVLGKKDIVKVENRNIKTAEINKIALIAPNATINRIKNYKVVKKKKVVLPKKIIGIVDCPNPQCITNKEREPVRTVFLVQHTDPLTLICKYCERQVVM